MPRTIHLLHQPLPYQKTPLLPNHHLPRPSRRGIHSLQQCAYIHLHLQLFRLDGSVWRCGGNGLYCHDEHPDVILCSAFVICVCKRIHISRCVRRKWNSHSVGSKLYRDTDWWLTWLLEGTIPKPRSGGNPNEEISDITSGGCGNCQEFVAGDDVDEVESVDTLWGDELHLWDIGCGFGHVYFGHAGGDAVVSLLGLFGGCVE
mmetsp:Transcript_16386/g.24334  ORF Transcript_16386/g.24334 Transcript_16386/m.24334 type:complete len:203 (+) Transcript_16386:512-1120(+)